MSTLLTTIIFCHLQFWRMWLSSSALEEMKKSWFSLALETETTESTWLSNARANFYNEYLEKITPSLSSLWIYSRTSKPSLFHTCYFDFTNIMGSKSGAGGKMEKLENPKRKKKPQKTKVMECSVVQKSKEKWKQPLPYPKGLIPGAWVSAPMVTFPALQGMLTQSALAFPSAPQQEWQSWGADGNAAPEAGGLPSRGKALISSPGVPLSAGTPLKGPTLPPHQSPPPLEDSQMLCWGQLAGYHLQEVSKGQKLLHMNKASFQVKSSVLPSKQPGLRCAIASCLPVW